MYHYSNYSISNKSLFIILFWHSSSNVWELSLHLMVLMIFWVIKTTQFGIGYYKILSILVTEYKYCGTEELLILLLTIESGFNASAIWKMIIYIEDMEWSNEIRMLVRPISVHLTERSKFKLGIFPIRL